MKKLWCSRLRRNRSAVACGLFTMMIMMIAQANKTALRMHADNVVVSTWSNTLFRKIEESVLADGVMIVFVMVIFEKIKIRCTALFQAEEVFQFYRTRHDTTVLHAVSSFREDMKFECSLLRFAIFRSLVNSFSWVWKKEIKKLSWSTKLLDSHDDTSDSARLRVIRTDCASTFVRLVHCDSFSTIRLHHDVVGTNNERNCRQYTDCKCDDEFCFHNFYWQKIKVI